MRSAGPQERRRLAYAARKRERERGALRREISAETQPSQESKRAKERRTRGEKPEKRTSADRTAAGAKCDYRSRASKDGSPMGALRSPIGARTLHPREKEARESESPVPDNANVRHIDATTPEMARRRGARTFDTPPGCIFRQNVGMGTVSFCAPSKLRVTA